MTRPWQTVVGLAILYLQVFNFYLMKRVSDLEELVLIMKATSIERTEVMQITSSILEDMTEVMQRVVYVLRTQYGIEEVDD